MDTVEIIIKEINKEEAVKKCRNFSSNFLNNAAEVYEIYGFGTTLVYLQDKKESSQNKHQAEAILAVLKILAKYKETKINRGIGRYIIKTLSTIKSMEA